jgi:hypothetical protein
MIPAREAAPRSPASGGTPCSFCTRLRVAERIDQSAIKPSHRPALAQGIEYRFLNPGSFSIRGLFDADGSCGVNPDDIGSHDPLLAMAGRCLSQAG